MTDSSNDAELQRLQTEIARLKNQLTAAEERRKGDAARRERTEQSLRESEESLREIVETMPVPVTISRVSDGLILYANRQAAETFSDGQRELAGRKTTEFYYDADDRKLLFATLARDAFLSGFELQLIRADGTPIRVALSAQRISFNRQDVLLTSYLDVTERHRAEESLKKEQQVLQRLLYLHERDRQLIAYEIHDGIVQDMTASLMFLETARNAVGIKNEDALDELTNGMRLLRDSVGEARRLINGLRPAILDEAGLIAATENLVVEMCQQSPISIDFNHDIKFDRLAPALEVAVFRIVQEGLYNVVRHSQSDNARVAMVQQDGHVEITVEDWGVGFNPAKVRKRRYGLTGVKERARLLGGQAHIKSQPGQGTRIRVELPLTEILLPRKPLEHELPEAETEEIDWRI